MKNKLLNMAVIAALGVSPLVLAQGHDHESFTFTDKAVKSLKLNSLLTVDDSQFVFNNTLLNEDWDNYFALHASTLTDKQELILHWAGYNSINPKLILALIEQQSGLLSKADVNIDSALAGLSDEHGFDAQLKDVTNKLSQRFYAYQQWQNAKRKNKRLKRADTALNRHFNASTAATAALVSVFNDTQKQSRTLQSQVKNNALAEVINTFSSLSPNDNVQTKAAEPNSFKSNDQQVQAANFSMNLPWRSGVYWYSGGAHSNTGSGYPYSSLDFYDNSGGWGGNNTPYVQAAHSGTVTRYSSCNVRVTHSSGYATNYYHMSNLSVSSGDYVSSGMNIGRYADNYKIK